MQHNLTTGVQGVELVNALRCRYLALHPCKSVCVEVAPRFSGLICPARHAAYLANGTLSDLVSSAECDGASPFA